jgi:hypothetical protein
MTNEVAPHLLPLYCLYALDDIMLGFRCSRWSDDEHSKRTFSSPTHLSGKDVRTQGLLGLIWESQKQKRQDADHKNRRPQRKQKRRNNGKHYSHAGRKISCPDDDADEDSKVENDKSIIFRLRQYINRHLQ